MLRCEQTGRGEDRPSLSKGTQLAAEVCILHQRDSAEDPWLAYARSRDKTATGPIVKRPHRR
jgi:hypothetical protein